MNLETVVKLAYSKYQHSGSMSKSAVEELTKDATVPATVLLIAARRLLTPEMMAWEPETLWQSMNVQPINRGKLGAAMALEMTPSFYWDIRVFGNTCKVLNDELTQDDRVPECTTAELAWGAFEAELIFALTDKDTTTPKFYEEVSAYTAAVIHHEGLVLVPENLSYCEPFLDKLLNEDAKKLRTEAKKEWESVAKSDLANHSFDETPLGSQLFRRAAIDLYFESRMTALTTGLEKL